MTAPRPGDATPVVDLVAMFLDVVEAARPPTPAVVVEHPDRVLVRSDPDGLRTLLTALVHAALRDAAHRAEIRLELGARPGYSFFLRDNGTGEGDVHADTCSVASRRGVQIRVDAEPGWGSVVNVLLMPAEADDAAGRAAYTGPVPLMQAGE